MSDLKEKAEIIAGKVCDNWEIRHFTREWAVAKEAAELGLTETLADPFTNEGKRPRRFLFLLSRSVFRGVGPVA